MSRPILMLQTSTDVRVQRQSWTSRPPIFAFVTIAFALLPLYRYELGPDGISYLSIASEYARGYWQEAVNAYWGPLYSWLLAFLLLLHVPGIVAVRMVAIASGAVSMYALRLLSARFRLSPSLRQMVLWLAGLVLLSFVVESETPDLLFTALLLLYTAVIFNEAYPMPQAGIVCGVLGALSFYTKSYGFAFFVCHFCAFNALAYWRQHDKIRRRQILNQFGYGLAGFLALSALWVSVLHAKYGVWTLGTSGEFNHRLVGPESTGYPHLRALMPPQSAHDITIWQNPSPAMLPAWSVVVNARHEIKLIALNLHELLYFWFRESLFAPILLLVYIGVCLWTNKYRWEWVYPVVTIAIFSAGYIFLTVEDRYFWYAELLLLLIAFRALELIFDNTNWSLGARAVLLVILVLSFAAGPLRALRGHFRRGAGLYTAAEALKKSGKLNQRFASCENWAQSAYIGYLLQEPYYGLVLPESDADEIARELNPDFKGSLRSVPTVAAARQELSSAHVRDVLVWPDCPIDAGSLGPVLLESNSLRLVEADK